MKPLNVKKPINNLYMKDSLNTFVTGSLGIVGVGVADPINHAISQAPSNLVSTLIQVIIGIVTIWKFFKPSKV